MRVPAVTGALFVVLALATGCGHTYGSVSPQEASDTASPAGDIDLTGDWTLSDGSSGGAAFELDAAHPVTLTVDGDHASGSSGCNRYMGTVEISGDTVAFGPMGGTMMACVPDSVMQLEQSYLTALGTVNSAAVDGDTLTLSGNDSELVFQRAAPPSTADVVGTTWKLDSLIDGNTVSTTQGEGTLVLKDDGTLSGNTGCRQFHGSYTITDGELSAPKLATTMQACPKGLDAQDQLVQSVITGPSLVSVEGGALTLELADGSGLMYQAQ